MILVMTSFFWQASAIAAGAPMSEGNIVQVWARLVQAV
jgi:hypothetical protein